MNTIEFDLSDVSPERTVSDNVLRAVVSAMYWIGVKTGSITRKNLKEVQQQIAVYQFVAGPLCTVEYYGKCVPYYVTSEDVAQLVGLKTNCVGRHHRKQPFKERIYRELVELAPTMISRTQAEIYEDAKPVIVKLAEAVEDHGKM